MAGDAVPAQRPRSKSDENVFGWLTGSSGGREAPEGHSGARSSFKTTVESLNEKNAPGGAAGDDFGGAAPEHILRQSHEQSSPKKRGWWGGVKDVMKGGQRSIDTIKLAKNMGAEHKKYQEKKGEMEKEYEVKHKFDESTDEAIEAKKALEEANEQHFIHMAEMFRDMAMTNGGFQVKICQMLSMATAIFPETVRKPLRECCEKAWAVPLATILPNIENKKRGLGCAYQDVFEELDEEALASASIGQVHLGRLRKPAGQRVLVKVQHMGVRDAIRADVAILPYLVQFVDSLDPNHGLRPLMYMISSMLEQEVDFRVEGANRERLAAIVDRSGRTQRSRYSTLYFPRVLWDYCGESVMVQEYMEGALSLSDRDAVEKMGIPFTTALGELAAFFAECCFVHGYMHNDLHFGNVMVRAKREAPDAPPPMRQTVWARKLLKVPNYATVTMGAAYLAALLGGMIAITLTLAVFLPAAVGLLGSLCPPLGAALRAVGLAIDAARSLLGMALGSAAGLALFFLGEHLAEQDLGDWLETTIEGYLTHPSALEKFEKVLSFHQQKKALVDKQIAEVADVRFELVIIDHGFHTHATYEYRLGWCKMWAGIGLCDEELLMEGCADFGLEGDDYQHMPMILTFFPYPVWKQHRFCSLSEFLNFMKDPHNPHGIAATQEVTNRKLPKQFHLMHRTSQQVFSHFNAEYGIEPLGEQGGLCRLATRFGPFERDVVRPRHDVGW